MQAMSIIDAQHSSSAYYIHCIHAVACSFQGGCKQGKKITVLDCASVHACHMACPIYTSVLVCASVLWQQAFSESRSAGGSLACINSRPIYHAATMHITHLPHNNHAHHMTPIYRATAGTDRMQSTTDSCTYTCILLYIFGLPGQQHYPTLVGETSGPAW